MKVITPFILIINLFMTGCASYYYNAKSVMQACKNGVAQYSDDTMNFKCFKSTPENDY